ncbi:MAG TPA: hypothetical protein VGC67_14500 [Cellulomonas sp.]
MRTMRRGRATERRQYRSDEGMSVVMVVTSFALLLSIVLVTSLYVVRSIRQTASFTDSELALSAAESGIADYFSRASASSGYWQTTDCDNVALQEPVTDGSATCGRDADTVVGWVAVEADADAEDSPAYHYAVIDWDTQNGSEASWITVQVTGRSGSQYRTVEVQATRESTEQYAGYQNHWARPGSSCTDSAGAVVYQWTEGAYSSSKVMPMFSCLNTLGRYNLVTGGWSDGGTSLGTSSTTSAWLLNTWVNPIEGDFFSNDVAFLSPGPVSMSGTYTVDGTLTLANPRCSSSSFASTWSASTVMSTDCGALPTFTTPYGLPVSRVTTTEQPQLSGSKTLPDSTSALETSPGCRYYGPTRIVVDGDTMTVWSKQSGYSGLTLSVQPSGSADAVDCGSAADLVSDAGATVTVPDGMVVYVQDLPADVATANGVVNGRLDAGEIGGDDTYGYLPIGDSAADLLATERSANVDIVMDSSTFATTSYRTEGNLWVEGVLEGTVTLGSEGSVYLTGDLVTAGGTSAGSTDQIGIVASEVTVLDQRVAVQGVVTTGNHVGAGTSVLYQYIDGADSRSGTQGSWPHDYDGDADQVTIEAAVQVIGTGFGYQDADNCTLGYASSNEAGYVSKADTSSGGSFGWSKSYYFDYPGVEVDTSGSGTPTVTMPGYSTADSTIDVRIVGSLAQNYLSTTGVRVESSAIRHYENSTANDYAGNSFTVTAPQGSCGMNLTVEYDERLQSSTPPYLLKFTDVGWQRGDSSEISTPARLRS